MKLLQKWTLGLLFLSLLFFGCLPSLSAQVIRTHTDGSKIIVEADGSARYFNTNEPVEDYNGKDAASIYPVIAVTIAPLDAEVSVSEEDLQRIAIRKMQLAEEAEVLAKERAAAATANRQQLEKRLAAAKSPDQAALAGQLQRQFQLAKKIEQEAAFEQATAQNKYQAAKRVVDQKNYAQAYNESRSIRNARAARGAKSETLLPHAQKLLGLPKESFTGYGRSIHQNGQLPDTPCQLAFEGNDPESGQYLRASTSELLFTHTDETLRPYLEGKEYLSATANIQSKGGYRYLVVRLTFANPNALQTYGYINKGSLLNIHLLDGNFIHLSAANVANGSWDEKRRELFYEVVYPIDRSMISTLRQSDLDYLQIFWSSGFEEYDIYQVDVLQRLLNCL